MKVTKTVLVPLGPIPQGPLRLIVFGGSSEVLSRGISGLKSGKPSDFKNKNFKNLSGNFRYLGGTGGKIQKLWDNRSGKSFHISDL